jgi:hypothetical protein
MLQQIILPVLPLFYQTYVYYLKYIFEFSSARGFFENNQKDWYWKESTLATSGKQALLAETSEAAGIYIGHLALKKE